MRPHGMACNINVPPQQPRHCKRSAAIQKPPSERSDQTSTSNQPNTRPTFMKGLVTGAAGFIGMHVQRAPQGGRSIVCQARNTPASDVFSWSATIASPPDDGCQPGDEISDTRSERTAPDRPHACPNLRTKPNHASGQACSNEKSLVKAICPRHSEGTAFWRTFPRGA